MDQFDFYVSRKIIEAYLLRHGISLDSIKCMDDKEVNEYMVILGVFDEMERDQMEQK